MWCSWFAQSRRHGIFVRWPHPAPPPSAPVPPMDCPLENECVNQAVAESLLQPVPLLVLISLVFTPQGHIPAPYCRSSSAGWPEKHSFTGSLRKELKQGKWVRRTGEWVERVIDFIQFAKTWKVKKSFSPLMSNELWACNQFFNYKSR